MLGIAIPLGLATFHLLGGEACLLVAAAAAGVQVLRRRRTGPVAAEPGASTPCLARRVGALAGDALPILATVATAWPALVRPLLNGDSLGYHLPNAASWVHDGHLWLTFTRYWWYPPASEMFAAGLLAVGGPFVIGLAGTAASLLLGLRLAQWGRALGAPAWTAGAIAAATLASFTFAEQAGNLDNDVWLGAFFVETLWAARAERGALVRCAATCAFVKPDGIVYALLALVASAAPLRASFAALVPYGLWALRDAVLWRGALLPAEATAFPHTPSTTIVANGATGLTTLVAALRGDGWWLCAVAAAGVAGIAALRDRALQLAAAGALVAFLFTPFAFATALPQLATGQSLRYATPFLAIGALVLARAGARFGLVAGAAALTAAAMETLRVAGVYRNDATTHSLPWVVALVAVALALPRRRMRAPAMGLVAAALVAFAARKAASHPVDYYDDLLGAARRHVTLFAWVAQHEPSAIVGWQLRNGALSVVSPDTRAIDALDADPCGEAKREHALLIAADDPPLPPSDFRQRRDAALACGVAIFRDDAAVVIAPR